MEKKKFSKTQKVGSGSGGHEDLIILEAIMEVNLNPYLIALNLHS